MEMWKPGMTEAERAAEFSASIPHWMNIDDVVLRWGKLERMDRFEMGRHIYAMEVRDRQTREQYLNMMKACGYQGASLYKQMLNLPVKWKRVLADGRPMPHDSWVPTGEGAFVAEQLPDAEMLYPHENPLDVQEPPKAGIVMTKDELLRFGKSFGKSEADSMDGQADEDPAGEHYPSLLGGRGGGSEGMEPPEWQSNFANSGGNDGSRDPTPKDSPVPSYFALKWEQEREMREMMAAEAEERQARREERRRRNLPIPDSIRDKRVREALERGDATLEERRDEWCPPLHPAALAALYHSM